MSDTVNDGTIAAMLIKEYRIAMPMSVDEYRIAQLYMIQVSARLSCDQKICTCPGCHGNACY